jgi:hypothetical protein
MSSELSREQLERILDAVETIEECLERLVRARDEIDRGIITRTKICRQLWSDDS